MNWMQLISTIIVFIGVPLAVGWSIHLCRVAAQKLPEHTRLVLEQFARMAVWNIEQTSRELSGSAKKQLAVSEVMKLYRAFKLPAPTADALEIAIEAAVYLLSQAIVVESSKPLKIELLNQG